jgi:hypothetical protein
MRVGYKSSSSSSSFFCLLLLQAGQKFVRTQDSDQLLLVQFVLLAAGRPGERSFGFMLPNRACPD